MTTPTDTPRDRQELCQLVDLLSPSYEGQLEEGTELPDVAALGEPMRDAIRLYLAADNPATAADVHPEVKRCYAELQEARCRWLPGGQLPLGRVVMTAALAEWINERERGLRAAAVAMAVKRHGALDWDPAMPAEDKAENDRAAKNGGRVLSAWTIQGQQVWVITEWDRSLTTAMRAEDY